MAPEDTSNAWTLHSQGRRFGPLSEDDLRGYFRAGMVKSMDRISGRGDPEPRPAAEVAAMLGETPPMGPPPPALQASSPVAPVRAPGGEPVLDERAAKAIAAMNIDLAAMAAPRSKTPIWVLPVVAGVFMIVMLFVALNMLKQMKPAPGDVPPASFPQQAIAAAPTTAPAAIDGEPAPAEDGAEAATWVQTADQLAAGSDWNGLLIHAKKWTEAQPERGDAWQFLGLAHARLGNNDLAAEAINRVLAGNPTNNQARSMLAEIYLQGRRWEEAANLYKELVAAEPQDARLWNNYGSTLGKLGQGAQAVAALETAVRLDPGYKQAWINLSQIYQGMGDSARASAAMASANAVR